MNVEDLFSRLAHLMAGSAIRKIGGIAVPDLVSFAGGYPAPEAFPWETVRDILRDVLDGPNPRIFQYGATAGHRPLRETVAELCRARGVDAEADRILVTTGSQQGLDLVARVLLDPGDVVLLERPSYTGAILAFRNIGATMVGIEQDCEGIDLQQLQRALDAERARGRRVKLLYVIPNFQNPASRLLGRRRREELLDWAREARVLILEDDPYRDIYFSGSASDADTRPIAADDSKHDTVVYLSSFSKTLAPGFRVGWMTGPPALLTKLEFAKQAADLCTGGLDQVVIDEACRRGVLAAQGPRLRQLYQQRRDAMVAALERHLEGRLSWQVPPGGFFLWARLSPPLSSEALLTHARAAAVSYVPGTAFYVDGGGQEHMRLSFSEPAPERIELGISRLAQAVATAAS